MPRVGRDYRKPIGAAAWESGWMSVGIYLIRDEGWSGDCCPGVFSTFRRCKIDVIWLSLELGSDMDSRV